MYLYKPKSKASSEPVDFWYMPLQQQQQPVPAAAADNLAMLNPQQIKPIKRGRAPKVNQDDPSSGRD